MIYYTIRPQRTALPALSVGVRIKAARTAKVEAARIKAAKEAAEAAKVEAARIKAAEDKAAKY